MPSWPLPVTGGMTRGQRRNGKYKHSLGPERVLPISQNGGRRHLGLSAGGAQQSPAGHSSSDSHGRADGWGLSIQEDGRGWGPRRDTQGQEGGGAGAWTGRGVHSGQAHTRVGREGSVVGKTRLLTLSPPGRAPAPGWDRLGTLPGSLRVCPAFSMAANLHPS